VRRGAARLLAPVLSATFAASACAAVPPAPKETAARKPPPAPLHAGPLTDYVPAAGLRWLVVGSPARLAEDRELSNRLHLILPDRRLEGFAASTGLDLRQTENALAAGFDFGTLYMAEPPRASATRIEELFTERLLSGANVANPHPDLRRVSGVVGVTPQMLVRIGDRLVAVAVGDPTPARIVEAFARRKLSKATPALRGSALSTLPEAMTQAPLRFYAPGPFQDEWLQGARGLFAAALAFGGTLRPKGNDRIVATLYLSGAWDNETEAAERAGVAWRDVAESSTGRLLGLHATPEPAKVATSPELLTLELELAVEPLVQGLHAAVAADVGRMLEVSRPQIEPRKPPAPVEKK
jgi:hypothetical protein